MNLTVRGMKAFVMYVPKAVVEMALQSRDCNPQFTTSAIPSEQYRVPSTVTYFTRKELGLVQKRRLTLLFVDIANFTTICETLSPERLIALMSEYLNGMCSVIVKFQGTLDKVLRNIVRLLFHLWGVFLCLCAIIAFVFGKYV